MKRTRLKSVSKKRQRQNSEYNKVRDVFLKEHPKCMAGVAGVCKGSATEIHHIRGRVGRLLCDKRFFLAICRPCHNWIGDNGAEARRKGLLAPAQEFNVHP